MCCTCVCMVESTWQELQPIATVYRHDFLTEDEFDKCQKVC